MIFNRVLALHIAAFMVLALTHCTSQNKIATTKLDSLANARLGTDQIKEFNATKSHVIYKNAHDTTSARQSVQYLIYRVEDSHLELKGKFSNGYIKWKDERTVEIKSVPEKAKDKTDMTPYIRQVFIY